MLTCDLLESQTAFPFKKENVPATSSSSRRANDGPPEPQPDDSTSRSRRPKIITAPPGLSLADDEFPPLVATPAAAQEPVKTSQKVATAHATIPTTPITSSKIVQSSSVIRLAEESKKASKSLTSEKRVDNDKAAVETSKDKELTVAESSSTESATIALAASSEPTTPAKGAQKNAGESTDKIEADKSPKSVEKRQRPGKLDIAAAKDATKRDLDLVAVGLEEKESRPTTPTQTSKPQSAPLSQPATPPTAISQTSASPAPRQVQPRTIRVVQTPKAESPLRMPSTGTFSASQSAPASKPVSRKASLSSIYQPGTPLNETISDNASYTSASVSRPGSPPPSKVGSAPIRQNTKSQQKKERQERARLAEEKKKEEAGMAAVPEEPIQAPIIGRKKKTKKANTIVAGETGAAESRLPSPKPNEGIITESPSSIPTTPVKEAKRAAKGAKKDSSTAQSTANQKDTDPPKSSKTASNGEALLKTIQNTAAAIFAELIRTGQIPENSIDLFKTIPALNYRLDISDSDPAELSKMPPLTDSDRQKLDQGEAICVETGKDRRVVILPDRRIQRGFTREQAQRYLTLRKSMIAASGPGCFHPARRNIEQWLNTPAPALPPFEAGDPRDSPAYPAPENMDSNFGELEYTDHFDLPMTRQGPAARNFWSLGNTGSNGGEDHMPVRAATMSVEEAEKKWMESKRETESYEKKLNAVIKKNRKILIGTGH